MTTTDQPTGLRKGEEIDAYAIDAYLKEHMVGLLGVPRIRQFPGGASNLTYLLQYENIDLVLRRPPFGHKAKSAHDMGREFRILNRLHDGFPYCPKAYVHCTDESVIGSEFYVMERIEGIILRSDIPAELGFNAERNRELCLSFIDRMVELHQVDYVKCGLSDLGKPEGYVRRQIEGWTNRYEQAMTPDAPAWTDVKLWLKEKMPADHYRPSLIHNDYRLDNVILAPEHPTKIIGVLDWEMTTIGDPLMDVGNTLAYWIQPDDSKPLQKLRRQPSHAPGMLTRREFADYYAARAGIQIDNLDYYYTYGLFRLAAIMQQIYYRYFHKQTQDERFASFIYANTLLEQVSRQVIQLSRL